LPNCDSRSILPRTILSRPIKYVLYFLLRHIMLENVRRASLGINVIVDVQEQLPPMIMPLSSIFVKRTIRRLA